MAVGYEDFMLATQGDGDVHDVSDRAQKAIDNSGLRDGVCTVFVSHTTCGVSTIECEPGANADLNRILEHLAPQDEHWDHNVRNGDTNGHSHARAALIGPSVTVPFRDGALLLGTWQRIVCIDFDDRPRSRQLVVQLLGE